MRMPSSRASCAMPRISSRFSLRTLIFSRQESGNPSACRHTGISNFLTGDADTRRTSAEIHCETFKDSPAGAQPRERALHERSCVLRDARPGSRPAGLRSEEHTSELQSLMRISYAVFCLKKKIYYS